MYRDLHQALNLDPDPIAYESLTGKRSLPPVYLTLRLRTVRTSGTPTDNVKARAVKADMLQPSVVVALALNQPVDSGIDKTPGFSLFIFTGDNNYRHNLSISGIVSP
jgi:hypothetical protein